MTATCIEKAGKLIDCLKNNNYFDNHSRRKDAQANLEEVKPETLFMYSIVVEKRSNFDKIAFKYIPEKEKLVRTHFAGHLKHEKKRKCRLCIHPCYKDEYTVEEFMNLLTKGIFEAIEFYLT